MHSIQELYKQHIQILFMYKNICFKITDLVINHTRQKSTHARIVNMFGFNRYHLSHSKHVFPHTTELCNHEIFFITGVFQPTLVTHDHPPPKKKPHASCSLNLDLLTQE